MNKIIRIYTLEGCGICESLKFKLSNENIGFDEISCSNNCSTCDDIESLVNLNVYPMIKVNLFESKSIIFCLAQQHSQINTNIVKRSSVVFYVHSIDNMIDAIKNM